jgi:hypothetical protein
MKPKVEGGVVDKRLNVYGTQNLKVAGEFWMVKAINSRHLNLSKQCWIKHL